MIRARSGRFALLLAVNVAAIYLVALTIETYLFWPRGPRESKATVVAELRSQGVQAYPSVHPQNFLELGYLDPRLAKNQLELPILEGMMRHPLAGIPRVPTVYCKEDDGWLVFESDAWGFNNVDREPESSEILFVGDSFVQGACVPVGSSFVDQLAHEGWSVYSLGIGGAGPLTTLAHVIEYAEHTGVARVVWGFSDVNDVMRMDGRPSDLDMELRSEILPRYLESPEPFQELLALQTRLTALLREQVEQRLGADQGFGSRLRPRLALVGLRSRAKAAQRSWGLRNQSLHGRRMDWYRVHRLPTFAAVLMKAREFLASRGKELVVLYLPMKEPHALKDDFIALFGSLQIDVIDLDSTLGGSDTLFVEKGGHYSIEGNRELAEALADAL